MSPRSVAGWLKKMIVGGTSHEVSGFESSPPADALPLGDLDRSAGCELATGGEVAGEAFSAGSEDSNPARALNAC
jgi:hypothetical protein